MSAAGLASRPARALAVVFFVNGATYASWIPRIPEVQASLELSTPTLGLALTGGGIGGLVGTAASPALVARLGSRRVAVTAGIALALSLPLVAVAPNAAVLAVVLALAGTMDALADIAMNDVGVHVQRRSGKSIMNRLHAGWSVGTVTGAVVASALAGLGVPVGWHLAGVGAVLVVVLLGIRPVTPDADADPVPVAVPGEPGRRRPALGAAAVLLPLAFAAAVVEGVPAEWSGVFLSQVHDQGPGAVGLGFTLFAVGMVTGRLAGDAVVDRLGFRTAGRIATGLTVAGLVAVGASGSPLVAVVGFGLLGVGASVLFPLLYGAAGSLAAMASGAGLALLSIGARVGFLAAPVLVGALASVSDLRVALVVLVGLGLAVVTAARAALDRHLR